MCFADSYTRCQKKAYGIVGETPSTDEEASCSKELQENCKRADAPFKKPWSPPPTSGLSSVLKRPWSPPPALVERTDSFDLIANKR